MSMLLTPYQHIGLLLLLLVPAIAAASDINGTASDDVLVGTEQVDRFRGGAGADLFVINHLSEYPDLILDFSPEEGDSIQVEVSDPRLFDIDRGRFSINRKGVVRVNLGDGLVDLVDTRRSDLSLEVDPRKNRYQLKFTLKTR